MLHQGGGDMSHPNKLDLKMEILLTDAAKK